MTDELISVSSVPSCKKIEDRYLCWFVLDTATDRGQRPRLQRASRRRGYFVAAGVDRGSLSGVRNQRDDPIPEILTGGRRGRGGIREHPTSNAEHSNIQGAELISVYSVSSCEKMQGILLVRIPSPDRGRRPRLQFELRNRCSAFSATSCEEIPGMVFVLGCPGYVLGPQSAPAATTDFCCSLGSALYIGASCVGFVLGPQSAPAATTRAAPPLISWVPLSL